MPRLCCAKVLWGGALGCGRAHVNEAVVEKVDADFTGMPSLPHRPREGALHPQLRALRGGGMIGGIQSAKSLKKRFPICTRKSLCSRTHLAYGAVEIHPPSPRQLRRLRRAVSPAVLRLWHDTHRGDRLDQSNRAPPSLSGTAWSATTAATTRPRSAQCAHRGCSRRNAERTPRHTADW